MSKNNIAIAIVEMQSENHPYGDPDQGVPEEAFTAPPAVQSGPARDCGTPMLLESMEYFSKLSKDAKC